MRTLNRLLASTAMAAALLLASRVAPAAIESEGSGWGVQGNPAVAAATGYLVLRNTSPASRSLLKVSTPAAERVEVQQTAIGADGVERQWPVGRLQLQPGEVLALRPQGRHLRLVGLRQPLKAGQRLPVTFVFEDEPPLTVELEIRPGGTAPGQAGRARH